jgi:hypothetical protein
MSKLLDYINALDKDAAVRTAHAADPVACMTNFGLSADEQDALRSGDRQRIADAIGVPLQNIQAMHTPLTPF